MNKTGRRLLFSCLLWSVAAAASADPFDGVYAAQAEDDNYRLTLEADGFGRYDGILLKNGEKSGLEAARFGERLAGRIIGPAGQARVRLELRAVNLLLLTWEDGKTIRLLRVHQ